jgi:hypothetical protein
MNVHSNFGFYFLFEKVNSKKHICVKELILVDKAIRIHEPKDLLLFMVMISKKL